MVPVKMFSRDNLREYSLLLQIVVVIRFGLVFLRVFTTSGMWAFERFYIFSFRYIPAGVFLLIILTICSPWLLLKRIRSFSLLPWWNYVAIGLSVFRIAEQFCNHAIWDYFLASVGLILFLVYFSMVYQAARSQGWVDGGLIATAITTALLLDTALRGGLWTLDLSWQPGLWPMLVVLVLAVTLAGLSFFLQPQNGTAITSPRFPLAWGILLVGFFFFFIQHLFGDISRILQRTGWPLETSLFFLLMGNLLAVAATWLGRRLHKKRSLFLFPVLFLAGVVSIALGASAWGYVIALYLAAVSAAMMLAKTLDVVFSAPGDEKVLRTRKVYLLSFILYVLSVMLFVISGWSDWVLIFVGGLMAIFFARSVLSCPGRWLSTPQRTSVPEAVFLVLLIPTVVTPLLIKRDQLAVEPVPPVDGRVKVMQLNIHQGVNPYGNLSLHQTADFIRTNDVSIVSMNEVSRGALWSGSADTLLWLAHELGMHAAYGPTMGQMSGNAFLSRFPFERVENKLYSLNESVFPSGCLSVDVALGDGDLRLVATHVIWSKVDINRKDLFDRNTGDLPDRVALFMDLVSECAGDGPLLLLGDMNAKPDTEAIQVLRAAGFSDAAEVGREDVFTWHATLPLRRIDYVFGSKGIHFDSYQVASEQLSDHFPILVSVRLDEETARTE